MKALATALLVVVAACGEGRAILNVDVLSFMSSDSTTSYNVPGGIPSIDSTITRMVLLPPGLGRSSVDSVTATLAGSLENSSGSGSVTFDVFFEKQQANLFLGTPFLSASSGPVSGAVTVPLFATTISGANQIFNTDTLWVGLRARINTNVGPNMVGQLRLTDISLRIVLQDQVF